MSVRLKTINADEAAYEGFRQLAKECDLTSPELVAAMVLYFRVTKADPRNPTGPDLTTSLAKLTAKLADLDKRTIGFIREQEKTYLKPILAEVQAHKVLSTPAASAPVGVSKDQADELTRWFERVLYVGLNPAMLTNSFREQQKAGSGQAKKDPQLDQVKRALATTLRTALIPDAMTPALNPAPTNPVPGAAPSAPASPVGAPISPTTKPA